MPNYVLNKKETMIKMSNFSEKIKKWEDIHENISKIQ